MSEEPSDSVVSDIRKTLLGRPTIDSGGRKPGGKSDAVALESDRLLAHLNELQKIMATVYRLQRACASPQDWQSAMMYIAGQKARVSTMMSEAKSLYWKQYGEAFDQVYQPTLNGTGKRGPVAAAEAHGKSVAHHALMVSERLESSWKDLQDLLWVCKSVVDRAQGDLQSATFSAFPDHLPFDDPDEDVQRAA